MPKLQLLEVVFYGLSAMWCLFFTMLPIGATFAVIMLLRRDHEGGSL